MNAARPSVLWLVTLAVVVAVVVLLHEILLPFVAGIALAYLLDPVVNQLEGLGAEPDRCRAGHRQRVHRWGRGLMVLATPILGEEVATLSKISRVHRTAASLCD